MHLSFSFVFHNTVGVTSVLENWGVKENRSWLLFK